MCRALPVRFCHYAAILLLQSSRVSNSRFTAESFLLKRWSAGMVLGGFLGTWPACEIQPKCNPACPPPLPAPGPRVFRLSGILWYQPNSKLCRQANICATCSAKHRLFGAGKCQAFGKCQTFLIYDYKILLERLCKARLTPSALLAASSIIWRIFMGLATQEDPILKHARVGDNERQLCGDFVYVW